MSVNLCDVFLYYKKGFRREKKENCANLCLCSIAVSFESNCFWCSSLVIKTVVRFHVTKIFCRVTGFLQIIIEWIKKGLEQKWSIKYKVAKDLQRLKTKQKWRAKEAKSKSISKSEYGDLRCNFTSTIHYQHETLELPLIIQNLWAYWRLTF